MDVYIVMQLFKQQQNIMIIHIINMYINHDVNPLDIVNTLITRKSASQICITIITDTL